MRPRGNGCESRAAGAGRRREIGEPLLGLCREVDLDRVTDP